MTTIDVHIDPTDPRSANMLRDLASLVERHGGVESPLEEASPNPIAIRTPMMETHGRTELNQELNKPPRTQAWLAKQLLVSQNSVSTWCRGITRPGYHHRLALQRLLGIDANDWMTAEERKIAGVAEKTATAIEQPTPDATPEPTPAAAA